MLPRGLRPYSDQVISNQTSCRLQAVVAPRRTRANVSRQPTPFGRLIPGVVRGSRLRIQPVMGSLAGRTSRAGTDELATSSGTQAEGHLATAIHGAFVHLRVWFVVSWWHSSQSEGAVPLGAAPFVARAPGEDEPESEYDDEDDPDTDSETDSSVAPRSPTD